MRWGLAHASIEDKPTKQCSVHAASSSAGGAGGYGAPAAPVDRDRISLIAILDHAGLAQFQDVLLANGVCTVDVLRSMDDTDLTSLGLKVGHRRMLKTAIAALAPLAVPSAADLSSQAATRAEESKLCVICLDRPASHAADPCFHRVVCEACSKGVKTCPVCRSKVKRYVRIFT